MGLFDRFRKRIHEVADETDDDALSVEATSEEAQHLLQEASSPPTDQDEDWDDVDEVVQLPETVEQESDDDWETWDDDEPVMPVHLSKKERKLLERQARDRLDKKPRRRRP